MTTMVAETTAKHTEPMFRALDPELPLLAARAAMQIDNLIVLRASGEDIRNAPIDAFRRLSGLISHVGEVRGRTTHVRSLMDPVTARVFSQAYSDASNQSLKSWQELSVAARKLSVLFGKGTDNSPEHLELMRDFCVKLSNLSASQRQMTYGGRPKSRYWR